MWELGWRERAWSRLEEPWDLIVIGGGVTGAGILREATRAGLRAVLFEAGDFGSGTSSRSSKLVHGGLRYLKNALVNLTIESVHERERLPREGRGLVSPLGFLMPSLARAAAGASGVNTTGSWARSIPLAAASGGQNVLRRFVTHATVSPAR